MGEILAHAVAGMKVLLAWQATLLGAEHMEGENQFFCTHCQKKVDARRQMNLVSTPPYLCLSLQRFVFDMKVSRAAQSNARAILWCLYFRSSLKRQ